MVPEVDLVQVQVEICSLLKLLLQASRQDELAHLAPHPAQPLRTRTAFAPSEEAMMAFAVCCESVEPPTMRVRFT